MRKTLATIAVVVSVLGLPALAATASAQTAVRTAAAADPALNVDEMLKSFRADMQLARADIVAKNITLSSEQASKFWPAFSDYQYEQNVIMDEQLKGIQQYAEGYQTLDDATALALMKAHLDRDARMTALRAKWLAEFQKILPAKIAARVMQIDRRLSLLAQLELASQIPLIQ